MCPWQVLGAWLDMVWKLNGPSTNTMRTLGVCIKGFVVWPGPSTPLLRPWTLSVSQ